MTLWCLPANDCGTFLSADLSRCKFAFGCKINHFLHKCAQLEVKVEGLGTYLRGGSQRRCGGAGLETSPQTSQAPQAQVPTAAPVWEQGSDFTQTPGKEEKGKKKKKQKPPLFHLPLPIASSPFWLPRRGEQALSPALPGAGSAPFPQYNVIDFLCRRAFAKSRLSHA